MPLRGAMGMTVGLVSPWDLGSAGVKVKRCRGGGAVACLGRLWGGGMQDTCLLSALFHYLVLRTREQLLPGK